MRPYISEDRCEKCKECVDACPYEVFAEQGGTIVIARPEDCIECTACVEFCLHQAISMGD